MITTAYFSGSPPLVTPYVCSVTNAPKMTFACYAPIFSILLEYHASSLTTTMELTFNDAEHVLSMCPRLWISADMPSPTSPKPDALTRTHSTVHLIVPLYLGDLQNSE